MKWSKLALAGLIVPVGALAQGACGFIDKTCDNLAEPCSDSPGEGGVGADSGFDAAIDQSTLPPPDGSRDGDATDPADTAPQCDQAKTPSQDPCVIDDRLAIFVAPSGADTNAGKMAAPVKTLARAIELAKTLPSHRVIACATTYTDAPLTLSGAASDFGVSIFGGASCPSASGDGGPGWTYSAGARATLQPSAHGPALVLSSLAKDVLIQDVEFRSQNGTARGESSITGWIQDCPLVTLRNVKLAAGTGAPGADGAAKPVTFPTAVDLRGNAASGITPGLNKTCTCPALGSSIGGIGGTGGGTAGGNGGDGSATPPVTGGGTGSSGADCSARTAGGQNGADATAGVDGTGASSLGVVDSHGWTPQGGKDGSPGGPGQGGGGGGGLVAGAGGGGGCGGCGGGIGSTGGGGGASIGLLLVSSPVRADSCEIASAAAGAGGAGAAGQIGQSPGGNGGLPDANGGCVGGRGGAGGAGGAGGGGAGGLSAGIVYKGAAPTLVKTTPTVPTAVAPKGNGGKATNDGVPGETHAVLALP